MGSEPSASRRLAGRLLPSAAVEVVASLRRRGSLGDVLARGATGSLVVTIAGGGVAVALQLLLARLMGTAAYGVYIYALTVATLLALLARLGIDTALVRFVAEYRVRKEWGALAGVLQWADRAGLAASLGIGLITAATAWLARRHLEGELSATLALAAAAIPLLTLTGLRQGALQGLRRVAQAQLPDAVVRPCLIALGAVAVHLTLGGLGAAAAMAVVVVAAAGGVGAGSWFLARSLPTTATRAVPDNRYRSWLRVSLPLLLVAGLRRILHHTDILLIGIILGTTEAGLYAIASRLSQIVAFGLGAVNSIAAPLISELHAQGRQETLQRTVSVAAWTASLSCIPIFAVLVLGRRPVLELFGQDFTYAAGALVILSLGQLVNAMTGPVGWLLNMTGHQRVNARIMTWVTALNAILNLPALLLLGIEGAALVTSTLLAVKNLWTWFEVRKRLGINASVLPLASSRPPAGA